MDPLVSVIIIVKNGERFIRNALESVRAQNYPHLELIIVDGRSEDHTLSIVEEFNPDRIIFQRKDGVSDAYNLGIKASRGDFLSFLSSDDIWMPKKLSTHIQFMKAHPDILFTNSLIKFIREPGKKIPVGFKKELLTGSHKARIMENLVARKEVFHRVGLFNNQLRTAEDVDWYSRAQDLQIPSHLIKKVLLKKRIHDNNTSMNAELNNKNLMIVLRKALERKKETKDSNF